MARQLKAGQREAVMAELAERQRVLERRKQYTYREIALRCRVSPNTVYQYFKCYVEPVDEPVEPER